MDEILLSVDTAVTSEGMEALGKKIDTALLGVGKLEMRVAGVNKLVKELGGIPEPKILQALERLKDNLDNNFGAASLRLAALKSQLREYDALEQNVANRIMNAQTAAYNRLGSAVKETQINAYQRNPQPPGGGLATDPKVLKLQIEAERRRGNEASVTGGAYDPTRMKELEAQLVRVSAERARGNAAISTEIRLMEKLAQLQSQYAMARGAGDTTTKFNVLSQMAGTRLDLALARNNFQPNASSDAAGARADSLGGSYTKYFSAQKEAAALSQATLAKELQYNTALTDIEKQQIVIDQRRLEFKNAIANGSRAEAEAAAASLKVEREHLALMKTPAPVTQEQLDAKRQSSAAEGIANTQAKFSLNGGADFFKVQAQVMANYQLFSSAMGLLRSGASFVVEFEAQMKTLQAIVGATNEEVGSLAARFVEVSRNSKFSAPEIAGAATILGQAGLSSGQINQSIEDIVHLATATGTDLKVAVDIATTTMTVFNVRASEMGNVANIVTAALNQSKLDAEKLALGLQYAGNIAADSGVSFVELTTALSAMSNAGIKSGSTLGTGLRQIIEALVNPSTKLQGTLVGLGLTMSDIDIRTHGLFGVLQTLRDAGFSATDAMKDLGLRGASAFAALSTQAGSLNDLQQSLLLTGDAAKANAIQMDSVQAQMKRLGSTSGALAVSVFQPLQMAFKGIVEITANVVSSLSGISGALSVVATVVGGIAAFAVTKWIGGLVLGLANAKAFIVGLGELTVAFAEAGTAAEVFGVIVTTVGATNLAFLALTAVIAGAAYAYEAFSTKNTTLAKDLDHVQTQINDAKGKFDDYQTAITSITEEMDKLNQKNATLQAGGPALESVIASLNAQFQSMGFYVREGSASVGDLTEKLAALRREKELAAQAALTEQSAKTDDKGVLQQKGINQLFGAKGARSLLRGAGFSEEEDVFGTMGKKSGVRGDISGTLNSADSLIGGGAPSTAEELSRAIEAIQGQITTLTREKTELDKDLGSSAVTLAGQVSGYISGLESIRAALQAKQGTNRDQTGIGGKLATTAAILGPSGVKAQDLLTSSAIRLSGVESNYTAPKDGSGKPITDGSVDLDKLRRDHLVALTNLGAEFSANRADLLKGMDAATLEAFKGSDVSAALSAAEADIKRRADEEGRNVDALDESMWKITKRKLEARRTALLAQLNGKTATGTIAGLKGELTDINSQLIKGDQDQVRRKVAESPLQGHSAETNDKLAEIADVDNIRLGEDLLKINTFLGEAGRKAENAAEEAGGIAGSIKSFTSGLKSINKALARSDDAAKHITSDFATQVASLSRDDNGNKNNISDVQRQDLKDKGEANQRLADLQTLSGLDASVSSLKALIASGQKTSGTITSRIGVIDNDLEHRRAMFSTTELNEKEAEKGRLLTDQQKITGDLLTANEALTTNLQKQGDIQRTINLQDKVAVANTIGQNFQLAVDQYQDSSGNLKNINASLVDSFKDVFGTTQSALGQFLTDIATKTSTVGRAFKDMAASIVKSLLQIATNKLAASIFGSILSLGAGFLGGGDLGAGVAGQSTAFGTTPGLDAVSFGAPLRQGGMIRAAQGMLVPGSVRTRDSVHAYVQPGEYISTQSTVDALGSGFFDELNATGGKSLMKSAPQIAPPKPRVPDVVNVYVAPTPAPTTLGPRDVIAIIADDMARGGTTKRLVKSVMVGTS
jgi:TP901 family phage tail tape measure protein